MKKKCCFWLLMALTLIIKPSVVQAETAVFAPFVSRLHGEVKDNLVRLSWVDSLDVRGPVYVYRSSRPFEGPEPSLSGNPIEIPYGVQFFVDEVESGEVLYYFVVASDAVGRKYNIPIIFTNTVFIPVSAGRAGGTVTAALKHPRVFVRDLEAPLGVRNEGALASVVRGPFAARNWEAARDELIKLLAQPHISDDVRDRARFYLGQSCYFLHMPREGLYQFLAIRHRYPVEASEWIQALLDMIQD